MNINQVKEHIAAQVAKTIPGFTLPILSLNEQKDPDTGAVTEWVSHWDDDHRVRISMPREVMDKVIANKEFAGLAVKKPEVVTPEGKAPYTRFVIITPTSIVATF